MITTTVILSVLKGAFKNVLKFFWEYKWVIILGVVIGALYARGNHYEDKYLNESVAHLNAVLQHRQDINDIRLANETALRVTQEESATKYKELAEQTSNIQKEYLNVKKILTLPLLSLILVTTACSKQSQTTPNVIPIPTKVYCQIPPMPTVYSSSVDYLKLVQQSQSTMLMKLQSYQTP